MKRTPKEVFAAITANIQQAMVFEAKARGHMVCKEPGSAFQAYKDCAEMIRTEAADILNEKPGQVRPFNGTQPPL